MTTTAANTARSVAVNKVAEKMMDTDRGMQKRKDTVGNEQGYQRKSANGKFATNPSDNLSDNLAAKLLTKINVRSMRFSLVDPLRNCTMLSVGSSGRP